MKSLKIQLASLLLTVTASSISLGGTITPLPEKIPCAIPDRQDFQNPDTLHLTGWMGMRMAKSEQNRLLTLDPASFLKGYRKRPGKQPWEGEHVGKWLHAATLAWVNTGDPALREKLDFVAAELAKCQQEDGYLGTYTHRWNSWDVWEQKYNLIGLMAYARYTGNMESLTTCRRMADLMCKTFGDQPGQRDLVASGAQDGLASTSVLEPMVLLYRLTGEPRYLDFCKYILAAWEHPNGPHIISTLLRNKRVDKVSNGKAYEMLSCINGALEYYRTTGDRKVLDATLIAWQDIVDKRLYLTGASSYEEHFHGDFDLPNTRSVGETCVTVTWIQINAQLLRLTGEARFAEQLERVVLNQLFGAQRPDGAAWGYYVEMEGIKPYKTSPYELCCLSSGPRGIALIPTFATTTDADGAVVNLYDAGTAKLTLHDQTAVSLITETAYPAKGRIQITVNPAEPKPFTVKLRIPAWCPAASIKINGEKTELVTGKDGYAALQRTWNPGDKIELNLKLETRLIVGDHTNAGKVAFLYGPLVLAADGALLSGKALDTIAIPQPDLAALAPTPEPAPEPFKTWSGAQVVQIKAVTRQSKTADSPSSPLELKLVPYADAGGAGGSHFQVWLPLLK